ncbi:hypothetical protein RCH06_002738 [Polaromonas sp. CG_9.5]|uniref:hypothetical protein n=1 Tax=Polaromonas sp. CG_9.5 TaxID=3071705 RepID=UPI002DFBA92A|nr:hypothetical protein [Polaromonas sp. CG_9.5]
MAKVIADSDWSATSRRRRKNHAKHAKGVDNRMMAARMIGGYSPWNGSLAPNLKNADAAEKGIAQKHPALLG